MTIYGTIKAAISVKQAAEHYGLKVNRNGMACCPFHNDRHPSLKLNEDYFFSFVCGAKGGCNRPCGKAVRSEQL